MNDMAFKAFPLSRSEVDDFLRQGDVVHAKQVDRINELEETYAKARAEIAARYDRRMRELLAEGDEKLRALDRDHAAVMQAEQGKLQAVRRLRDGQ